MTYNGLIKVEDFKAIIKTHQHDTYIEDFPPLIVSGGYCLVTYISESRVPNYALLQHMSDINPYVGYVSLYIEPDNSIPNRMYSCSKIECSWCEGSFAELHENYQGIAMCNDGSCGHATDLETLNRDYFIDIFKNAILMKKYPRWRWMK